MPKLGTGNAAACCSAMSGVGRFRTRYTTKLDRPILRRSSAACVTVGVLRAACCQTHTCGIVPMARQRVSGAYTMRVDSSKSPILKGVRSGCCLPSGKDGARASLSAGHGMPLHQGGAHGWLGNAMLISRTRKACQELALPDCREWIHTAASVIGLKFTLKA